MRHLRRHANGLPQRRMRVNRLANIDGIGTHLYRQRNFADHTAAEDLAVAPASMAASRSCLGAVVEQ